ncbi:MAG TPA: radical SAM protein [candidate division Zixibacteria bacterium]|nr:radical SAM protein [candidate division Zixibacteria bacterium]
MSELTTSRKLKIAARTVKNLMSSRPVTVSFEITYNCNARCEHCDLGDYVKEPGTPPEVFADWLEKLRPAVAQISGGEPFLRKDLVDIIAAMRRRDPVAVFVLTTNTSILNEDRYKALKEAGLDQFSISLDYPDERHSEFRHLKGNFDHIRELIPKLAKYGNNDIILACVVQSDNFRDLPKIAELAREWGVACNFSTYNALRTGKEFYLISDENGDLKELTKVVDKLVEMQNNGYPILTSEWTMRQMIEFFRNSRYPNCQAGRRFLIVNPWGRLTPCGMCRDMYDSQAELLAKFTDSNTCDKCFTAIRANSEKTPKRLLLDALRVIRKR